MRQLFSFTAAVDRWKTGFFSALTGQQQLLTFAYTATVIGARRRRVIRLIKTNTSQIMKKATALLLAASLALGSIGTAQADWGRHGGYRDYRPGPERHYHGHRGGPGWIGPAAALAIAGLAVGAVAYNQYQPAPVYVAPPPPPVRIQPAPGNWYYCGSAGEYYPYVQYCPEGWQQVMPPR